MRLLTLGGLGLEAVDFGRTKPLLVLSFLALEGPKERRYLAELFWPAARDPLNSLSVALTRLRKTVPGVLEADETRAWTTVRADAGELLSALSEGRFEDALELYTGPFLHGVTLADWGVELEEWVYATRETLAARMSRGLLKLAELGAAQGRFASAARRAERALTLEAAPEPEPEDLARIYALLQAGESPLAARVKDEAAEYGVALALSPNEARSRLQRTLLGRERERRRLGDLRPGDWLWLRGSAGMGKTALLKSLDGTLLPGRSGLPFATLEPLVGSALQEGESGVLQRIRTAEGRLLIDNWERVDPESQRVLTRLHDLGSAASVVISSREGPPFKLDTVLKLGPLSREDLERYPDAWEKTQGLPVFVDAFLRDESLSLVLADKLEPLSEAAQHLYFALTLLDQPDTATVRRALNLSAADTAQGLEELLARGFTEPSGQVRVRQAALEHLNAHPTLLGPLCLALARVMDLLTAYPLYQQARSLWTEADEPRATQAYLAWAKELIERGFPRRAVDTLEDAPDEDAVRFLRARALERAGRYREGLELARGLSGTPDALALKSTFYHRLGKPAEAKAAAEAALEGGSAGARAEALNTLGDQARAQGEFERAIRYFRRASTLWQSLGRKGRWADALSNAGVTQCQAGKDAEADFREALEIARDNPARKVKILMNLAVMYNDIQGEPQKSLATLLDVIENESAIGETAATITAWINIGNIYYQENRIEEAERAYQDALALSQQQGSQEMTVISLAALAQVREDREAWNEAMHMMTAAGYEQMADLFYEALPANHPFRVRSEVEA